MSLKANKPFTDADKEALRLELCFERGISLLDRTIQVTGEIVEGESFNSFDAAMTELERDSKKTITIRINSPGGDVYEALAIVGRIESSKCHVVTECYGQAMSSAGLILACGNKRRMSKRAWFMYHEAADHLEGSLSQLKDHCRQIERIDRAWATAMETLSKRPQAFWIECAQRKDFYMSATECLEVGIVDEIF